MRDFQTFVLKKKWPLSRKNFSLEFAVEYCMNSDDSDVDSSIGSLTSDEEEEIDNLLLNQDYENISK